MKMKQPIFSVIASLILISCSESDNKDLIIRESKSKFQSALYLFRLSKNNVNIDSLENVYSNKCSLHYDSGYVFAANLYKYALHFNDSIRSLKNLETKNAIAAEVKTWLNSKAGKIKKKHPDWSREECELVLKNKIWIGMTLEMLKYERGNPNSASPSNYGSGVRWQWCWDDYTPSCFYGGEDGIITSYN